jgi:hypothetical protein
MSAEPKTVDGKELVEFTLDLNNIRELFEAPEFDPFVPQSRMTSGIEEITDYLSTRRMRKPPQIKATVRLPADQMTPDIGGETKAALGRYCEFELRRTRQSLAASRFEGRNKLPGGLVVAVTAVVITIIIFLLLPKYLDNALVVMTPVVTVIVWVSIWNPVETLLYDRWDDRRDLQIYTALQNMELQIQAA